MNCSILWQNLSHNCSFFWNILPLKRCNSNLSFLSFFLQPSLSWILSRYPIPWKNSMSITFLSHQTFYSSSLGCKTNVSIPFTPGQSDSRRVRNAHAFIFECSHGSFYKTVKHWMRSYARSGFFTPSMARSDFWFSQPFLPWNWLVEEHIIKGPRMV